MQGRVDWKGGSKLVGTTASNQEIEIDWEEGPSPVQITLQMVGACAIVDVVIGLKEREFTNVWVELNATRAETTPRHFTSIDMEFHIVGNVPTKLAERIADKAIEKYCSVAESLRKDIEITNSVVIHPIE